MNTITREKQIREVNGWWNTDNIKKWDKQYDDWDVHTMRILNRRMEKVLKFIDWLKLPRGARVLELGYGAGQTALKMGLRGFEVHGIDTSEKFHEIATRRCQQECPEGKFNLKVGNLESKFEYEDNTFDLVVETGVLHYLYDVDACLREVYRVLKPGGHFVVGQRKAFALSDFTSIRTFLRSCVYFMLREKYELFPSFKSALCDSKLGAVFGKFEDSSFLNSKFMFKGHDVYKYKLKKNLFSFRILKNLFRKSGLIPLETEGAYYCLSINPKYWNLNLKVDDFLEKLSRRRFLHFISGLAYVAVIVCKKKDIA